MGASIAGQRRSLPTSACASSRRLCRVPSIPVWMQSHRSTSYAGPDNDQFIKLFADTRGEFTKAVGMFMSHPGPMSALGNDRCKRFVLVCENGIVKSVAVSEAPDDPAGDNDPKGAVTKRTLAETILDLIVVNN